ncbi:MAG: hypothetical protein IPL65_05160 [Lewinellaceae bacterium]|nr:hypothetical protein [Lewinellaceae bacterium]
MSSEEETVLIALADSVLINTGITYLLMAQADSAQYYFEWADSLAPFGINPHYLGHVDLLRGDSTAALLAFGKITQAEEAGYAIALIERMASIYPTRQPLYTCCADLLRKRLLKKLRLQPDEVDYYNAHFKIQLFRAQANWKEALHWSEQTLEYAQNLLNEQSYSPQRKAIWLNACLDYSYDLLFNPSAENLGQGIGYVRQAQMYLNEFYPDYAYKNLLYTNLAHALWLRNGPGDHENALTTYRNFFNSSRDAYENNIPCDPWEMLYRDFRDIHRAGVQWPDLPGLIQQIAPIEILSPEEWKAIGVDYPPNH